MKTERKLMFVDTNILLDFYRCRTDAGISLLKHLDAIKAAIVMTYQVEMEFKKHRQKVILESFRDLKPPDTANRPGLFSDAKAFKGLQTNIKAARTRVATLKKQLHSVFLNPTTADPVYKVAQRLFTKGDDLTLDRNKSVRFKIRRLAWKRFIMGYPPRKDGDTSTGDAINWEWIIHCAGQTEGEIVIVSRDGDYGVTHESESFLNDWLLQEFKQRVSQKRKIRLFSKLSDALKLFEVRVTRAEEKEESQWAGMDGELTPSEPLEKLLTSWRELMRFADEATGPKEKANPTI